MSEMDIEAVRKVKAEIRDVIKKDPDANGIGIGPGNVISVRMRTLKALSKIRNRFGKTYKGCEVEYLHMPEIPEAR